MKNYKKDAGPFTSFIKLLIIFIPVVLIAFTSKKNYGSPVIVFQYPYLSHLSFPVLHQNNVDQNASSKNAILNASNISIV